MNEYDFKILEEKWKKINEGKNLYQTSDDFSKEKHYVLDMFPYPSGEGLHIGHTRIYTTSDIYTRMRRMQGYNVLHPTGWDAFGLPAEQFAIKNKIHPRISTDKNIDNYRRQMKMLDLSYDFNREIDTTDPHFYKWTQWIFLQMYKKGLAYESYEPINWCPSCQTGLANEDLENGNCERCGSEVVKKPMRQWMLRITNYADRLLQDLNTLPLWPEWTKELQKNWIGKVEGSVFSFSVINEVDLESGKIVLQGVPNSVEIFTTRADTLFGASYIAISAETAKGWFNNGWKASDDIKNFTNAILEDQKEKRFDVQKEKKGIFTGVLAVNPVNNKKIPIWIANYVLGGVGTGAIMAVPAHDERDYEFATEFGLPIHQVIAKHYTLTGENAEKAGKEILIRKVVDPILRDNEGNFYLIKEGNDHIHFAGGGVDEDEDEITALSREIKEETGFVDFKIKRKIIPQISCWGYRHTKDKNQRSIGYAYEVILNSDKRVHSEVEDGRHELLKIKKDDVLKTLTWEHHKFLFEQYLYGGEVFSEDGILVNSEKFDGLTSKEAKVKITERFGGKLITRYKLEDWVFARQRYWGEPIPIVHDEHGTAYPLHESVLPVVLPKVDNYAPSGTGESPLVNIEEWINVFGYVNDDGSVVTVSDVSQAPEGKEIKKFRRESNTMPQWAGSSWYYLRFADSKNDKELISEKTEKYWQPVDVYVGGAEHATRHLIYSRFYHKFLYDIGVVSHLEPFTRFESVGLVLGDGGAKMSKRLGNVINPDDVVKKWGIDVTRTHVAFMGSFYDATVWDDKSIIGCERFLERVWKARGYVVDHDTKELNKILHQTIKKVTEDISVFKFNTAVSQLMICLNAIESNKKIGLEEWSIFVRLLAPFATVMTEELWQVLGYNSSVHLSEWPKCDEDLIAEDIVTIALQIGGKLRGTFTVPFNSSDEIVKEEAKKSEGYKKYVSENEPKKIVVVKNKVVNVVI